MKKHISIKAASCLDMIHAINGRISELDPGYVGGSETINASDDGFFTEEDMEAIDRNGSDEEVAVAALSYYFGLPVSEAKQLLTTIDDVKLQSAIGYYMDRGLPKEMQLSRADERSKRFNGAACNTEKEEVTAEEYIHGAETTVDEAYVDEMMQYVADETASFDDPAVCSWNVDGENLIFVVTGLYTDNIDEYTCPLTDFVGDIATDSEYVLDAIRTNNLSE